MHVSTTRIAWKYLFWTTYHRFRTSDGFQQLSEMFIDHQAPQLVIVLNPFVDALRNLFFSISHSICFIVTMYKLDAIWLWIQPALRHHVFANFSSSDPLAPYLISTFTTLSWPFIIARWDGVHPLLLLVLTAAPLRIKSSTVLLCPNLAALCSGVYPQVSQADTRLFPFSSRNCTTSLWPFCAAQCSGVYPQFPLTPISAPFLTRRFTVFRSPRI